MKIGRYKICVVGLVTIVILVYWLYVPSVHTSVPNEQRMYHPSLKIINTDGYLRSNFQLVNKTMLDSDSLSLYRACDERTRKEYHEHTPRRNDSWAVATRG